MLRFVTLPFSITMFCGKVVRPKVRSNGLSHSRVSHIIITPEASQSDCILLAFSLSASRLMAITLSTF